MDSQHEIPTADRAEIQLMRTMYAKLEGVHIRRSDDDDVARVTITGTGRIVELQISEAAMRYPNRLGQQVTTAVNRARQAANTLADRYREAKLPGTSSAAEIESALPQPLGEIDVSELDWADSAEAKRRLVDAFEAFNQVLQARKQFKIKKIRQEIGVAAGGVEINIANTQVHITLSASALQNVGHERLSKQILDAIKKAEEKAASLRQATLDRIRVDDVSIGMRIRSLKEQIGEIE